MDDLQPEGVQSAGLVRAPKQIQTEFVRGKLPNGSTVLRPTAPASAVIPSEWFARWSQH
jgi:hypothetical protein